MKVHAYYIAQLYSKHGPQRTEVAIQWEDRSWTDAFKEKGSGRRQHQKAVRFILEHHTGRSPSRHAIRRFMWREGKSPTRITPDDVEEFMGTRELAI